jgi:hypothetical protein
VAVLADDAHEFAARSDWVIESLDHPRADHQVEALIRKRQRLDVGDQPHTRDVGGAREHGRRRVDERDVGRRLDRKDLARQRARADQAPQHRTLAPGLQPARALERAIREDVRARIRQGGLTGRVKAI